MGMKEERTFRVAGHDFSLVMAEDSPVWNTLKAYDPFTIDEPGSPIFTVEVTAEEWEYKGEPAYTEECEDEDMPRIDVFRTEDDGWQFRMSINHRSPVCCVLDATKDLKKGLAHVSGSPYTMQYGVNNSLMLLYALNTAGLGTLEMHSSVIMCKGKAFLFLAKSGTGKSTHSSLWLKHIEGSELMNDDNPIVRVFEDGSVIAYGSPWSGKTPCYKNISAPVGAMVRIRRAPFDKITRLSIPEAYASVYSSSSGLKFETDMADGLHDTFAKIAISTPCYVLDCLPDEMAARVCAAEVLGNE